MAREIVTVFAQRADELVSMARSDDEQLLGALVGIARGTSRATRVHIALTIGIALYVLVWTITVSATHAL